MCTEIYSHASYHSPAIPFTQSHVQIHRMLEVIGVQTSWSDPAGGTPTIVPTPAARPSDNLVQWGTSDTHFELCRRSFRRPRARFPPLHIEYSTSKPAAPKRHTEAKSGGAVQYLRRGCVHDVWATAWNQFDRVVAFKPRLHWLRSLHLMLRRRQGGVPRPA